MIFYIQKVNGQLKCDMMFCTNTTQYSTAFLILDGWHLDEYRIGDTNLWSLP